MSRKGADIVRGWLTALVIFGGVLAALLLSGCPTPSTCVENGCPARLRCDPDLLVCVTIETDCREDPSLCSESEFCSSVSGRCFSQQQRCGREQAQCPRGQQCDAAEGVCKPIGLCNADLDCSDLEQCSTNGVCEPIACDSSADCGESGVVCVDGSCQAGCDPPSAPCPEGRFCRQNVAGAPGECIAGCSDNQDCNFGFICDLALAQPQCIAEGSCAVDAECREDEICRQGACVQSPCTSDEGCPAGLSCARTQCVGGDCTEDNFSPNHDSASASVLEDVTLDIANLSRCAGRPDWYAFDLSDGELLEVEVRSTATDELVISLHEPSLDVLRINERASNLLALDYQARSDERVLLRVDSSMLENATYSLAVSRSLVGACEEDSFEQNDSAFGAFVTNLQENTPVSIESRLCNDDEDWFELSGFDVTSGLRVSAEPEDGFEPRVELYLPDGKLVEIGSEPVEFLRIGSDEPHLLRAYDPSRRSGEVGLTLTALPMAACESSGMFGTVEEALDIVVGFPTAHTLCPGEDVWEIDWYALSPPAGEATIDIRIVAAGEFPDATPALRAALWAVPPEVAEGEKPEPELIRIARAEAGGELVLSARVQPDVPLAVRVSSDDEIRRLTALPQYQIRYQYR